MSENMLALMPRLRKWDKENTRIYTAAEYLTDTVNTHFHRDVVTLEAFPLVSRDLVIEILEKNMNKYRPPSLTTARALLALIKR